MKQRPTIWYSRKGLWDFRKKYFKEMPIKKILPSFPRSLLIKRKTHFFPQARKNTLKAWMQKNLPESTNSRVDTPIPPVVNPEMSSTMKFFCWFAFIWVHETISAWLPKKLPWATLVICIFQNGRQRPPLKFNFWPICPRVMCNTSFIGFSWV